MKNFVEKIKPFLGKHKVWIMVHLYVLLSSALLYYCLELGNKNPFLNGVFYTFVNILTVFVVMSAIYLVVRRWWIASGILSIPVLVLSVANYYTLMFRNSPISTQDIHNAGTALSVMGSYNFPITAFVIGIVIFFALNVAVIFRLRAMEKGIKRNWKSVVLKNVSLCLFGVLFTHFVYFASNPIKPRNTFVWSWEDSYYTYGYAASSIEVFQNSMNMINKPEGYSAEFLEKNVPATIETAGNTPDVILILNETLYDMRDLVEIETDVPVMPFIDSIKTGGRAVVAGTGGGTNKSEYELLTSNSLQLMPAITPFNYLNYDNANSVVNYVESMGYTTWGAHCAEALNYKRGIVYPKLGFDSVLFREEFENGGEVGKYGVRPYATDDFCFDKMLADYEKMGDAPRFMYMLTIQNHGGWDINPSEEDTVHTLTDFGEYTDDMDEFLSCVNRTDNAFKELTEYFEKSSRPTVICMVGDHAPSFATSLLDEIDMEKTFALRSTPYVVWANFDLEGDFPETLSMPTLVPLALRASGMSLSPYYSYICEISEKTPVLTAFNLYKDNGDEIYNYNDETPYKKDIDHYMNMVYNNVGDEENRIQRIFDPENTR